MNIVKGVADLFWRGSSDQTEHDSSRTQSEKFSSPSPSIHFSSTGDEAILKTLWEKYKDVSDQVEKKKVFQVFILQFLHVYKSWEPSNSDKTLETGPSCGSRLEDSRNFEDILVGCSFGHPSDVILTLIQQIEWITSFVMEYSASELSGAFLGLNLMDEGLNVLHALVIVCRSIHNCTVFCFYGGMQKLTALMKSVVIQLKTMTSVLASDENLPLRTLEKIQTLQKLLLHVVSVVSCFINLRVYTIDMIVAKGSDKPVPTFSSTSEVKVRWHQKAIISVMEAGGLNWLVELLRVIRRLRLKEQGIEISLQYITLHTLMSTLCSNPRAQNLFRSIGGLEVLIEGLGLPPNSTIELKDSFLLGHERGANISFAIFQLQILSLATLREAVFGNLNNLQYISENGRTHKLANSICYPTFMLQEFQRNKVASFFEPNISILEQNHEKESQRMNVSSDDLFCSSLSDGLSSESQEEYAGKLSQVICSFIVPDEIEIGYSQALVNRSVVPLSLMYWEFSIKWIMKVLLAILSFLKTCFQQNEFSVYVSTLSQTLQHYILYAFRKVLVSSPMLLEIFHEEGIWRLIFSENFFYFDPTIEDLNVTSDAILTAEAVLVSKAPENKIKFIKPELLQMEVISFVEFVAALNSNSHNLPECSALLDALEHSSNPQFASVIAKSLHRILQLAEERTVASFKSLNAARRILKIASTQIEASSLDSPAKTSENQIKCFESLCELFSSYLSSAYDAKFTVLHDPICIDSLFNLFWEKKSRKLVLDHILGLMKLPPLCAEDHKAKMLLCSKYLVTFTHVKEQENNYAESSIDLLGGIREIILTDPKYYQALFRDGECFLHILSLLNGQVDETIGEQLVLNVLQTLTCLISGSAASKASFRALVGVGYQTLQNLLLDFCQWKPSVGLLDALLDMLVDGNFHAKVNPSIENDDVIIPFLSMLQKSKLPLQHYGLDVLQDLLKESLSNRASCFRAGVLSFLLDWIEEEDSLVSKIADLIHVIGGHSISGKDIRKIFALIRSEKIGSRQRHCSLLLTSIQFMLKEKGPTAFFDFNGNDSGIVIKSPIHWPCNKGFTFSCWIRVENFPVNGMMGLFAFLTENGKGCSCMLGKEKLVFESNHQKRQTVSLCANVKQKKWHFLCITHTIGRAFSGGSLLRCYLDGELVSSEKCRYPKVNDVMTQCTIGAKIITSLIEEGNRLLIENSFPFLGQIGPVYMFNDAISFDQMKRIYSFGPSYMYSFLSDEMSFDYDIQLTAGILDSKDGLASKIIFGLSAQASNDGRSLFNVASPFDYMLERSSFEATILSGTQLCSRRLLQQIIYCVGGVSVFFPLLTQFDTFEKSISGQSEYILVRSIEKERLAAVVIELVASVLDENFSNQQQMHHLSGFSILGFLFQSIPPAQLNMETLSALKRLLNIVTSSAISELLVKEAISKIYLNPLIWVYVDYDVQRELYMFLIRYFENNGNVWIELCSFSHIIDIVCQFYWDKPKNRSSFGIKPLLHPITGEVLGTRPSQEEVHKIRLLLLSLAEMSLRKNITASDVKSLVAFLDRSQDMACIEDVLHMIIRAISHKPILDSFLEEVNLLGGCHVFVNLLQREVEPIRLQGLQFLGKLLLGFPSEKKGSRLFNLPVARSKSSSDNLRKSDLRMQPIFSTICDKLFKFPKTDHLCAMLFDILLGGASPKQVLQKHSQNDKERKKSSSHFALPQMLVFIFKFLLCCEDATMRLKIMEDFFDLLDSNPSNIEALMEHAWNAWVATSVGLYASQNYRKEREDSHHIKKNVQSMVRRIFCAVLSHYILSVKGGWQQIEDTMNNLLFHFGQEKYSAKHLLRDIFEDLIERLVETSLEINFFLQPFRDNTLYLLRLVDEILLGEIGNEFRFSARSSTSSDFSVNRLELEGHKEIAANLNEVFCKEANDELSRGFLEMDSNSTGDTLMKELWWNLYDKLWALISEMNERGSNKLVSRSISMKGPSLGQRARGLVESLNIPASEMAAVVVSGGIGSTLGGKTAKNIDKAMLLRGEKCPRIIFRLVIIYVCKSDLERTKRCVQQFISLFPSLLSADDEQSKARLQLLIWSLLAVRSMYQTMDDGARYHVLSHLIRETISFGKFILPTSLLERENLLDPGNDHKDTQTIKNLIQKDRILSAVADEAKYIRSLREERSKQIQEFHSRMNDCSIAELDQKKALEDDTQKKLSIVLASDEDRKAKCRVAFDENKQIAADKWIHMFRALVDERGPWSPSPFPNNIVTHWKLDKTEDAWRRRPKLKRNYHFNEQLCHPPAIALCKENGQPVSEFLTSLSSHIPEQMKRFLLKGVRGITDESSTESQEDCDLLRDGSSSHLSLDKSGSETMKGETIQNDTILDGKEYSSTPEKDVKEVHVSLPCLLVTPKRKLAGYLAVTPKVMHFCCEFLIEGTGGSSIFGHLAALKAMDSSKSETVGEGPKESLSKCSMIVDVDGEKQNSVKNIENISSSYSSCQKPEKIKRHRRWNTCKIKAVHWTRYLLRYTAIEIFFSDSVAPVFLNFESPQVAKDVGTLIVSLRNDLLYPKGSAKDKIGIISFVDRRVAIEMAETARERWRRRDITNFEYLMILNTLSGRSYNDLTQYPIFPWVLADYSSEKLDFNSSTTFRDLSKPVGALDSKRFEVFQDRYQHFSDPDIPSFYYGSHYSSMGIVLYYLIRLEPFTALHRTLQGGKFDHADRLFQCIEDTYKNCLSNTSDVKELIPEFFYFPEFLINSNSYYLGMKQDGSPLVDVSLPPWAKGSPEEFIYQHREALESEFVSSNLHHWIDLIFGYKQRGKPAVEAANVFYYLTYEGAVDLETIGDELQRSAIEDQIANFGQTPVQIFRKKHPRRGPPIPIAHPLYFAPTSITLTSLLPNAILPHSSILFIGLLESSIVLVDQKNNMSIKIWLTTQLQSGGNFTFSSSQDSFFGIGSDILSPRKIGSLFAENIMVGSQCWTLMQTAGENFIVSCGNWENSFQIISLDDGRMVQSIRQHKDVVSCVAVTSDGSTVATGSYDTTVMVWKVSHIKSDRKGRNSLSESFKKEHIILEKPFHILCGHDDIITCLVISSELDIVISGSNDGTCIFHTLREGRYVRSIQHPSGYSLSKLVVSKHGRLVFYSEMDLSLNLFTINGKYITTSESNGRLNCLELSTCGEFLACAGDQGQIVLRSMHSLDVVRRYDGIGKIITSLTITPEECFLVGTKDGNLLVYSIENPQLRRGNTSRNIKPKLYMSV